jgi:coenzyme F420-reducing hydrogenase delta subunit
MEVVLWTIKLALTCVALWLASTYFGIDAVALALALLALAAVGVGNRLAERRRTELQSLLDRLGVVEGNLDRAFDRLQDRVEGLEERIRRVDQRIDALTPYVKDDD